MFTKKISTCSPDGSKSYTKQFQQHKPSGYCYLIKCFDDNLFEPKLDKYTAQSPDEDISQRFISSLENSIKDIYEKFKYKKNLKWTKKDKRAYKASAYCHICEGELLNDKVADHCHLTGKFRGAPHNKCNLEYRIPKFFPVIFHNLAGYDAHLFVKNLCVTEGKINCIPKNEENCISFTKEIEVDTFTKEIEVDNKTKTISVKRELRFIDSFKFMATSLDSLANNLPDNKFNNLSYFYEEQAKLKLLKRKGVYPYDYMDCFERLSETTLPPIESFYSELNKSGISEDNYTHAQNVWKTFEMETLQDYHDLYLKTDVLLLADVFENFRDVCQENYGLDPAWYYTAPGLAWDAALKVTKVELELLADPDMLLMIEKGIRGGVSMISTRYGKANNPYMGDSYDPNQPTKYISYLDANNLNNYIIHHGSLKLYEKLGLRITKIHRGIKFVESNWLEPYIMKNTNLRMQGKNNFEKDFFKLMNNSVFGKTMGNIRNRVDIHLVTDEKQASKFISKPNYQHRTIFCDNLAAIHMKKTHLVFNKPVYLGMCIFDLSKTLTYEFHYNYIKPKYGEKAKLLFTDTDSLMYEIETDDFYKDISPDVRDKFDTSNYSKDHPSGIETGANKKVIGMFKDEAGGLIIIEFVGLRAKLSSFKILKTAADMFEEKKCKGTKKAVVKKHVTFDDYKRCLFNNVNQMRSMNVLRSHNHEIFAETVNKVALSYSDDKKIICKDGIHTYSYGHFSL